MGGGGSIGTYENQIQDVHWAINRGYFDREIEGIYYYCLICRYIEGFIGPLGKANGGHGFVIAGASKNTDKELAHTFMHELAHFLIDEDDTSHLTDDWWWMPDAGLHCPNRDCAFYVTDPIGITPTDYCNGCWNALDLIPGPPC